MAFLVFAGFSTSLLYRRRPQPGCSWAPAFNRPRWRANDSGMELRFAFLNVPGLFWIQVLVHRCPRSLTQNKQKHTIKSVSNSSLLEMTCLEMLDLTVAASQERSTTEERQVHLMSSVHCWVTPEQKDKTSIAGKTTQRGGSCACPGGRQDMGQEDPSQSPRAEVCQGRELGRSVWSCAWKHHGDHRNVTVRSWLCVLRQENILLPRSLSLDMHPENTDLERGNKLYAISYIIMLNFLGFS
ncbi:uncharacterized protein GJ701_011272 [Geothlypis trichas]